MYTWGVRSVLREPHPYGRVMVLANKIAHPDYTARYGHLGEDKDVKNGKRFRGSNHKVASWGVFFWLFITLGLAAGYSISFLISQQTMIYYILRKKVDGIEMTEVYEEAEDGEKPSDVPAAPPAPPAEPAKSEEKKGDKK
jgi:hypothetical protein